MKTKCLIVIPVGPGTNHDFLTDTLESIHFHIGTNPDEAIICLINDSGENLNNIEYISKCKNIIIEKAKDYGKEKNRSRPVNGPLFGKIISCVEKLYSTIEFDVYLKIDTDTLITGNNPHLDAIEYFKKNPDVGILGSYKRKGDGKDKTGGMKLKGDMLQKEITFPHYLRNFRLMKNLKNVILKSKANPYYTLGDTVTGGGYFINPDVFRKLNEQNIFNDVLRFSLVGEDTLFALLASAVGFKLSDPDSENNFMAINWRGLPMPLEEIVTKNKKILHPVKLKEQQQEREIRNFFKILRSNKNTFKD